MSKDLESHEVEMCSCGKNPASLPHLCPYKQDTNGDNETLCTCCDDCTHECAVDI